MIEFNYSGKEGPSGASGKDGTNGFFSGSSGSPGGAGEKGWCGEYAEKMDVQIATNGQIVVVNEVNQGRLNNQLPLGSPSSWISLLARGGQGGQGGRGGDGGNGAAGSTGSDATETRCGRDGGDGGNGGDGGDGGDGGRGGDGGAISIYINTADMDLLMLLKPLQNDGGEGGEGGRGGSGGYGAPGGRGGAGMNLYENGTRVRTLSGGREGRSGINGSRGSNGSDGINGQKGRVIYSVEGQPYGSRYDIKILQIDKILSPDGVIEPGEQLLVQGMVIQNTGGMHTPHQQGIFVSIINNDWIHFEGNDQVQMRNYIDPGSVWALAPLRFTVREFRDPVIDTVFKKKGQLNYRAVMQRVNKEFDYLPGSRDDFIEIRYPVEMSQIQIFRSITANEESPFSISVWNRSYADLGSQSQGKRLLNFRLMLMNKRQYVEFSPKELADQQNKANNASVDGQRALDQNNFIQPLMHEQQNVIIHQVFLPMLPENSRTVISGTIKWKDLNIPMHSKLYFQAKLDIGYLNDPEQTFQNIQTRNFHIQLTESHSLNHNADFLLVFNCDTSKQLIDSFKAFALALGSDIDLWNISNYQGFSYDFKVQPENQPLKNLYKNKVIIILANQYSTITNAKTNAVIEMRQAKIYKAAKEQGIHAYIIADTTTAFPPFYLFNPKCQQEGSTKTGNVLATFYEKMASNKAAYKKLQDTTADGLRQKVSQLDTLPYNQAYTFSLEKSVSCFSKPNVQELQKKAVEIQKKLQDTNFTSSYLVVWDYDAKVKKSGCFSKDYSYGTISVSESLRRDVTMIAQRNKNSLTNLASIDESDMIILLKLLPFEKKLQYFTRTLHLSEMSAILLKAIISDLTDEYNLYVNYKQKAVNFENTLVRWFAFSNLPFNQIFNGNYKTQTPSQMQVPQTQAEVPQTQAEVPQTQAEVPQTQAEVPQAQVEVLPEEKNEELELEKQKLELFEKEIPKIKVYSEGVTNKNSRPEPCLTEENEPATLRQAIPQKEAIDTETALLKTEAIDITIKAPASSTEQPKQQQQQQQQQQAKPTPTKQQVKSTPAIPSVNQVTPPQDQQISPKIKANFISNLIYFKTVLVKQLSFFQKYCCCSSPSKLITKHCIGLLEGVLTVKCNVLLVDINKQTQQNLKIMKSQSDTKETALLKVRQPYQFVKGNQFVTKEFYLNNHHLGASATMLPNSAMPKFTFVDNEAIYIQQGSYDFQNEPTFELNEGKRQKKIKHFEDLVTFEV